MLTLGLIIMIIGHIVVAIIIGKFDNQFAVHASAGYAGAAFIYMCVLSQRPHPLTQIILTGLSAT